jgi:DNA replication protein DnaC
MTNVEPFGEIMKNLIPGSTSVSEIEKYICDGCGQEVVIVEMPLMGGPDRGKVKRMEKGCICWEIEQGKMALYERSRQRLKRLFDQNSTINPDLQNANFESFETSNDYLTEAKQLAMNYVESFNLEKPYNLLFGGKYGLGKSHLSVSICKGLNDRGFTTIFISAPKLLTRIRGTYNGGNVTELQLLDALATVECLALDDIGAEKSKKDDDGESWAVEKLFEVIDGRSGRHTIYTTNLNSDELSRKVGLRNFSRMMMNTKPFKFEGDDYRIKNKRF